MRIFVVLLTLAAFNSSVWGQTDIPETTVNHAWVQGVYWNETQLPGWGFFVDVQEETFFGAVYGYQGSDSTFITMQGSLYRLDPLQFRGDVYFVTNGGANVSDVGNFTWLVTHVEASPAATLTLTSNILDVTNLDLVRFVYSEIDKIDTISGADWNLVEEILITFGDSYSITDERLVSDGITYVEVVNNNDSDDVGLAAYYPPNEGDLYGMLVPMNANTDNFFVFYATDTNMFGRYWLLDEGESPTGNGYYFHGSIANMQEANNGGGGGGSPVAFSSVESQSNALSFQLNSASNESKIIKKSVYRNSVSDLEPMFTQERVQNVFESLSAFSRANSKYAQTFE